MTSRKAVTSSTNTTAPTLAVENLSVTFPSEGGNVQAVRGVDLQVGRGEVLCIVGESGSGKSTVALALMGLLPQSARVEGSARFKGDELIGLGDRALSRIRGKGVGMVFQDPLSAFTPVYTIGTQISEALRVHQDISRAQAKKRSIELLDLVGIPQPDVRANAFPHEYSGGMRQRAMIAMAIANDPDLIIADEPTTALDVTVQAQVLEVMRKALRETGAGLLLITHDLGIVAGMADRVAVMYAGRVVEQGGVDEVYASPGMPYTLGLLGAVPRLDATAGEPLIPIDGNPPSMIGLSPGCPFASRCPAAIDICTTTEPPLVEYAAANQPDHLTACHRSAEIVDGQIDGAPVFPLLHHESLLPRDATPRDDRAILLIVEDLVREYPLRRGGVFPRRVGTVYAVDGVSFDVRAGEALALVGESGCGKTSTVTEVMELRTPQGGSISVLGSNTSQLDSAERFRIRGELQIVFQDPLSSLDPRLPVGDIIGEPLQAHGVDRAARRARVSELLTLVGLEPSHINRYPSEFSGGQRQRIAIARALALEPALVVLDEPVSALDVSIQAGVLNLLADLRKRLGLAYVMVAHDLAVVRLTADRVAVMYLGRIVEIGAADAVFSDPRHPYTQALMSAVPLPDPPLERARQRIVLVGDQPSPTERITGCRFRSRCFLYTSLPASLQKPCEEEEPGISAWTAESEGHEPDHIAACWHAQPRDVV